MKGNIAKEYPYIGDYYGYTREEIPNEDPEAEIEFIYTYFYSRKVKMNLRINLAGELIIFSQEKMQLDGKIRNLLDKNNEEIYEGGEWTILQTAPLLSSLGTKEGYQYIAILTDGEF